MSKDWRPVFFSSVARNEDVENYLALLDEILKRGAVPSKYLADEGKPKGDENGD